MPVATTLATALPEMVPNSDEAMIAILAAPPRYRPKAAIARSVKKLAPPERPSSEPKNRNETTTVDGHAEHRAEHAVDVEREIDQQTVGGDVSALQFARHSQPKKP